MTLKNKVLFTLMLLGSGLFLYQGFSLLFNSESTPTQKKSDINAS